MDKLTPKETVKADAEWIYIGNIYTIEENLTLPTVGKFGSGISWNSDKPYLISPEGKVVRPREGAGNREVKLTATVNYEGETAERVFEATVLALKSNIKIAEALIVCETVKLGEAYCLPEVVIVKMDDGLYKTSPVKWKSPPDFASLAEGVHNILGEVLPETEIVPKAEITISKTVEEKEIPKRRVFKAGLGEAKITDGFLNENRIRAEEFLLGCDTDTLLFNFREAAGLDTKGAPPMAGWDAPECLLKGHTTGHYLSAIALAYAGETENRDKFGKVVETMVSGLKECQDAMERSGKFAYGFLSGYDEEQFDKLQEYVVYPKIWAPYYTLHKILSGLIDCYEFAGKKDALEVASKVGTWIYNRLSKLPKEQLQKMWSMYIAGEFGGINESLARLAKITNNGEYLKAAKFFDNEKLFEPMTKNIDTLGGMHANQHVPQVVGALELYGQTGDIKYFEIAKNFWHFVTDAHIYCNGGSGEGEMFQDPNVIGTKLTEKTTESCVSYNMLKLTGKLFEYEPKSYYMDYFEKTLLNHIAASQDQSGPVGGSTYFMPLLPGGKKGYDSKSNTCCHGSGLENHVKYQDSFFYTNGKTVYVNQYAPSQLDVNGSGALSVTGDYLRACCGHKTVIEITRKGFEEIRLRIPKWSEGGFYLRKNGEKIVYESLDGFAVLKGEFVQGDEIEVCFTFEFKVEPTKDAPDVFSLHYGPLVMVALCESEDFLKLKQGFEKELERTDTFCFRYHETKFVPNYFAWKEKYHAYMKWEN